MDAAALVTSGATPWSRVRCYPAQQIPWKPCQPLPPISPWGPYLTVWNASKKRQVQVALWAILWRCCYFTGANDSCTQRNSQKGVFKQMDATFINYFTHTHTRVRIHSLFLTLTRGLTIKYSSILKVMGMYTMSVSRKYLLAVWCLQMHWFKSATYYRCISCSFPNNLPRMCG
jgi:hypothetical protein